MNTHEMQRPKRFLGKPFGDAAELVRFAGLKQSSRRQKAFLKISLDLSTVMA
ncbi:MAG: hypothetical protein RL141_635 [Candidatus Parcubacteria bacterium]|jgi:hypothetical protein